MRRESALINMSSVQKARRASDLAFLAGILFIVAPLAAQVQLGFRIVPLVRDDHVLVTFELADVCIDEVRSAIHSGLKTTFTYTVDLRTEVPAWVDRTIASAVVSTAVQYDNLTRRHTVVRTLDGRVEDSRVIESDADVRRLVTSIDRLPLFKSVKLEPNREYYVRVRAEVRPRNAAFLWPWGGVSSAQAKFTFIP